MVQFEIGKIMLWLLLMVYFPLVQSGSLINPEKNACSEVFAYHFSALSSKCYYNPDVLSNLPSMAERHGYDAETFYVVTEDGYILKLFRIKSKSVNATNSPVFVIHGIAIDAESWANTGKRSLAFNLADNQYDVWIGTLRGTINSNQNVNLSINNPEYWNFNLDIQADKDFNVQLDFIANKTNKKILIIGHSMGTTLSFMYASQFSEKANQIIEGIVALAPVVYLTDVSLFLIIKPFGIPLIDLLETVNIKGLFYQEELVHQLLTRLCKTFPETCYFLLSTASGRTKRFVPEDMLVFLSYWLGGTSIYQLKQYLQIAYSGRFQKFDYGNTGNEKIYGTATPPEYNLTNINVPVFLFYGENDIFYKHKNIKRLYNEIGSTIKYKSATPPNASTENSFCHIDFVCSKNITKTLYNFLYNVLNLYL